MISINATLVIQMINFLVLIWILNRLLFKPIFHILEEREVTMTESKIQLETLRDQAEEKAREFEKKISSARKIAAEQSEETRREASTRAKEIIDEAKGKAKENVAEIQAEAEKQAESVRESLAGYKDAIVEMVLLKVMGRKVS